VITSKAFIDRTGIQVPRTKYLYLEDVRAGVGTIEKLRTLLGVRWFPKRVRARCPKPDRHQPAVVLFTSGSEKAPKAVPLTPEKLLSDQRAGGPVMELASKDVMLGVLPAFHSFGMNVTGLLPILCGIRVVR